MRVLVSGSSGFIGSALVPYLKGSGDTVVRLLRRDSVAVKEAVLWDPAAGTVDRGAIEGCDAVVHLAGENIAGRWTMAKKEKILTSRVRGTRVLCETLASASRRPRVLICASATGFYGNRGSEILAETSGPGRGFLSHVCQEWEAASGSASDAGIRVVNLRFGLILSTRGGALARMLPPFRLGLGGPIGRGEQFMSWIAIDDLLGVIAHALRTDSLRGPVNAVSPQPVTNREFTLSLGRALHRPARFKVPSFALRMVLGAAAEELLLASCRAIPTRLLDAGYVFGYPELDAALTHVIAAAG